MAKFTITIAGKDYEIEGPANATLAQARDILTKQLDTGGLVGFKTGDFLNIAKQAEAGLKGAIAQLGANVQARINSLSTQLPDLTNVSVTNPIDVAKFVNLKLPSQINIGSLVPTQVQALMAQTASIVNQPAAAITNALGVGKYGLTAANLEKYGLLKPGTTDLINKGIGDITSVLGSASVWTGKLGATNLSSILGNDGLQNTIQQGLMSTGFSQLSSLGAITSNLGADKLGPILNNAAKYGTDVAAKWVAGLTSQLPPGLVSKLDILGKSSVFAGGFAALGPIAGLLGGGGSPLVTTVKQAKGFLNTVNRSTVNFAFSNLIKNPKVPIPSFTIPKPLTSSEVQPLNQQLRALEKKRTDFSLSIGTSIYAVGSPTAPALNAAIAQAKTLLAEATALYGTVASNSAAASLKASLETIIGYYKAIIAALEEILAVNFP
jgi:hypothetical protein